MLATQPITPALEWLNVLLRHKTYGALFIFALLAAWAATPLYIRFARRLAWLDRPGGRKQHAAAIPTMGGLVVFAAVYAGIAVTLSLGNRVSEMLWEHRVAIGGALACTAAMILVGVIDDRRGLSARVKLLVQLVLALAAFVLGFRVAEITIPWLGSVPLGAFSIVFSILWIVGITNAINLTDGLDGLAVGIGFLAAAANAVVAIYLQNYYMAVMMLLLAGALLGFLPWNFHPARVFLGDTGSLGLGMFLALCSLHSAQKSHTVVMILVPLCALGYPIFDTLLTVARRTIGGQPLFASDREHIHHRLADRAYGPSGAAWRIYAVSLLLIVVCVLLSSVHHLAVGLGLAAVLVLAVFSVRVLGYLEWGGWLEQFRGRDEMRILHSAAALARLKIAAAKDLDELLAALGLFAAEIGVIAIELDHANHTHRWSRFDAATPRPTIPLNVGNLTARLEIDPSRAVPSPVDPRSQPLWDELCRLADRRLAEWRQPAPSAESPR
jgi:UDP-GlcNAc:undecaprenyl-phosphate GlcNAc-1-phosphate transferase